MDTHVALLGVVEDHLVLVERLSEFLIHVGESEALPQESGAHLFVADVGHSQDWIVTDRSDLYETLFDNVFFFESFDCVFYLRSQLLSCHADKIDIEVEAECGLESDIDLLLRASVKQTFWLVEFKALLKDFLH
jgi:hypothetical protein